MQKLRDRLNFQFSCTFLLLLFSQDTLSEDKSLLQKLNGKNVISQGSNSSIGKINAKDVKFGNTILNGSVYYVLEENKVPVRKLTISLMKEEKTIKEFQVSHDGTFAITEKLTNGIYELVVDTKKYYGSKKIEINGFELKNIQFIVTKKDNAK